jgi:hypothetical protein
VLDAENTFAPFGGEGPLTYATHYRNGYGKSSLALNRRLKKKAKNRSCLGVLNS